MTRFFGSLAFVDLSFNFFDEVFQLVHLFERFQFAEAAELEKEKHLSTQAKAQLDQLKASTSRLTEQLGALGQANSSVASLTGPTGPSGLVWSSSGWQRPPG